MEEKSTFLKTPWLIILGVVFVLVLAAVFMALSGSILRRQYHRGNATISGLNYNVSTFSCLI
jgi:hypothetical protein